MEAIASSPSRRGSFVKRLLANRSFLIGATLVAMVVVLACLAGFVAPFDPLRGNFRERMAPPGMQHWMGTDHFGRDILSRVLFGARISLLIGLTVTLITAVAVSSSARWPVISASSTVRSCA
jgi:peptide/nickel transport system permease protein